MVWYFCAPVMAKRRKTPLRKWLDDSGETISGMARVLDVSRGRAQHWVIGRVMPRGRTLTDLMQLTGLNVPQLLPHPSAEETRRRERDKRRKQRKQAVNGKSR